jgi:hypothetical protein
MSNNLIRKPKISVEQENHYRKLGFLQNPFPANPSVVPYSDDARVNGSIFLESIRQEEIKAFHDHIVNSENQIGLMMDYAAYKGRGIGKTAFLNYMKKSINKDLGDEMSNGNSVIYAVYVAPSADNRNRTLSQVAHSIFTSMHKEGLFLTVFCRLRALSGLLDDVIDDSISECDYEKTIADDSWLSDRGVDVPAVNAFVSKELVKVGLADEDVSLFSGTYNRFMEMLTDNPSEFFWKKEGLVFLFEKVEKLLKAAMFTNCIILLDEAEKMIQYQNFMERRAFCENLRTYFIDGNNSNAIDGFFKILLTIHPNSQELLMPHWAAAGLDRFCSLGGNTSSENTIFFKPMSNEPDMIRALAEIYLKASRINKDDDSISPFTQEAIDYTMEKSAYIPGKFLKYLYILVEKAIKNNWIKIDKNEVAEVLDEGNKHFSLERPIEKSNVEQLTPTKIQL